MELYVDIQVGREIPLDAEAYRRSASIAAKAVMAVHMWNASAPQADRLAIDFPNLKVMADDRDAVRGLGGLVRVLGSMGGLHGLLRDERLKALPAGDLTGETTVSQIQPVPSTARFAVTRRVREHLAATDASLDRRRRRLLKRLERRIADGSGETLGKMDGFEERVRAKAPEAAYPFLMLRSLSSGEEFTISLDRRVERVAKAGSFSSYGLSHEGATVPSF